MWGTSTADSKVEKSVTPKAAQMAALSAALKAAMRVRRLVDRWGSPLVDYSAVTLAARTADEWDSNLVASMVH